MKKSIRIIFSFIAILIFGCTSNIKVHDRAELSAHMLAFDRDGKKDCSVLLIPNVDPKHNEEINCNTDKNDQDKKLDNHIKRITDGLKTAILKNKKVELLLFIHGGLVTKETAANEAGKILNEIDNINRSKSGSYIYPVFVNWESGMDDAYFDHLYRIRQGREAYILGPISSTFYFIADLGRAFTRIPVTYGYQGYNAVKHTVVDSNEEIEAMNSQFYGDKNQERHAIWLGANNTTNFQKGYEKSTYLVPGFLKLLTTPMLDMIGKSSWENMLRRTKLLFRTPDDYNSKTKKLKPFSMEWFEELFTIKTWNYPVEQQSFKYRSSSGGISKLMEALRSFREYQQAGEYNLSVTLIGHSMGAIVMSDLLRRFHDDQEDLIYNDIVYMAAACTIQDFENAVIPYLGKHEKTNFYNLTLHPIAEENENYLIDIVPRGSLLVWIDDFASTPETRSDLTLGRWNNAKIAWPFIPEKMRKQITLKAFGIEDPSTNRGKEYKTPQKHGEFNDVSTYFWRREYWAAPNH